MIQIFYCDKLLQEIEVGVSTGSDYSDLWTFDLFN